MGDAYRKLGGTVYRQRVVTLVLWAIALILALPAARRAPQLLDAGSRPLEGTPSAAVAAALAAEFSHPFVESLAVTFHSTATTADDPRFQAALPSLVAKLRALPGIVRVVTPDQEIGPRFISEDRHDFAVLIGLGAVASGDAEKLVPAVRALVADALPEGSLPGWEWHVTGRAAMVYDLNHYNAADSQRAEFRALPLTLAVLLLAFGSLVSATVPLALGLAATLLALAAVPVLGQAMPLNILYQNVVTLLGLALGIDYSLLLVSRYREQRYQHGQAPAQAIAETMATAGVAITYSGFAVLIGLAGLLLTPIFELRSIGIGGMVVVAVCLLLSLTLLPALLTVIDPWLDAPAGFRRFLRVRGSRVRWERWTSLVLRRPGLALGVGTALLLAMSAPLLSLRAGFPDKPWLPPAMETTRGLASLARMGRAQELTPITLVVRASGGGPLLPAHLDALFELSRQIHRDPHVARVFGPVDLGAMTEAELREFYADLEQALSDFPELDEFIFNHARDAILEQVVLTDETGYDESLSAVRKLAALNVAGLTLTTGGHWPAMIDFDAALRNSYPRVFGAVGLATLLVLLFAFRSLLVPLKAIALNALSVSAAFGATVAVFQWGWGGRLLGLSEPTGAIPLTIPLMVFCVTFGLSMDYEVFILSRVREEYLRCRDGDTAVRRGLIATGGLISGAAAIMVVVFGAFALADVLIVKMLGFGLAVAVAVDAAVVRVMIVPAAMKLAGRWNWFPGIR